jgi:hypothetical protein
MYEHGEPSVGFPVVDLSLEEEEDTPVTSQDEEITRKLFGDLNCGLLGPLGDDIIIILNDSDVEEEVCKDDRADAEIMPSSARNSPAPSSSTAADDGIPHEVQDDSNDGGDEADTP